MSTHSLETSAYRIDSFYDFDDQELYPYPFEDDLHTPRSLDDDFWSDWSEMRDLQYESDCKQESNIMKSFEESAEWKAREYDKFQDAPLRHRRKKR